MSTAKSKDIVKLKEAAPNIPRATCATIDSVNSLLNDMEAYSDAGQIDCFEAANNLLRAHMEYLRFCNSKLRESGRYWYSETCDSIGAKKEIYDYE